MLFKIEYYIFFRCLQKVKKDFTFVYVSMNSNKIPVSAKRVKYNDMDKLGILGTYLQNG